MHTDDDKLVREFLRDKYGDRFNMASEFIVRYFLDWDNDGGVHVSAMSKQQGHDVDDAGSLPSEDDLAETNTSLEHHCQVLVATHPRHSMPGVEWDHTPGVIRKLFVVWPMISGKRSPPHFLSLVDLHAQTRVSLEFVDEMAWGVGVVSSGFVKYSHLNIIPVHRFMGTYMSLHTEYKKESLMIVSPFVHSCLPASGNIRY